MSESRKHPDLVMATPDGQEFAVCMEGGSSATFTYDDGSALEIVQDADGERQYRVSPWPPTDETETQ